MQTKMETPGNWLEGIWSEQTTSVLLVAQSPTLLCPPQALSTFSEALVFSFAFFFVWYGRQHTQLVLILEAENTRK